MLGKLFVNKEQLQHDLGYCRLYNTRCNGVECTKMYFTIDSPAKYEFLRGTTHHNILPVYRITQHSIFTKHVIPFETVFNKAHKRFNEYIIAKLRETLKFIHETLKIEHGNIVINALFLDDYGNILLGKFDRAVEYKSSSDDDFLLNELSLRVLGRSIENVGDGDIIFRTLENRDKFAKMTVEEKREFARSIVASKEELMGPIIKNIIKLFIDDISNSTNEEYKTFILDILMEIGSSEMASFTKELFSILNSHIRTYLLQNLKGFGSLDECAAEICLGLRVKDRILRNLTIHFIFKNESRFSTQAFTAILEAIREDIVDHESIALVCTELAQLSRKDVDKPMYKLMMKFILNGKSRQSVYKLTEQLFPRCDKYKISTDLLPLLCSKLGDPESQDGCFLLVEKILSFLKEYRNEIRSKEWSFKNIKGMFVNKKAGEPANVDRRIQELSQPEDEEWAEEEFD